LGGSERRPSGLAIVDAIASALAMRCMERENFGNHPVGEAPGVHGHSKYRRGTPWLLLLVPMLGIAGEAAAAKYFFRFSGKPGSIVCTPTSNTINPGLTISWNLPPATPIQAVVEVGKSVVFDDLQMPPTESGTIELQADTTSWKTATPLPYTVVHSMEPRMPGAKRSTLRYDCVDGKGTNFRISNAPPY
jgi:hypothetical protein